MKALYHRIIIATCLFLVTGSSFAANFKGIGLTLVNDSISSADCSRSDSTGDGGGPGQGLALTISAFLTNYDSVAYNGPVSFDFYDTASAFIPPIAILNVEGIQGERGQVNLGAHEKVAVVIHIILPFATFRPGPDVVVVWPITRRPVADSIVVNVQLPGALAEHYASATSISNTATSQFSYIIAHDKIELVNLSAGLNFKQVRIFSMNGQQLLNVKSNNITEINLPNLPSGVYNCELLAADNSRKVIRFVR